MVLNMTRLTLSALGFCLLASPSFSQMSDLYCDDSARIREMLDTTVGAERMAYGLRGPETVLEVWVVPRTGEWTMVHTYATGSTCIVAIGDNWEGLEPAAS